MTGTEETDLDSHWWARHARWVGTKDPGFLAVKRSIRAAVVMPMVFGLTHLLFSNPQVSLFGAFGSFALLLLVDFPGRPRTRLALLRGPFPRRGVASSPSGTVVSTDKVAAVAAMAVVGFVVLFVGDRLARKAATASTAALLVFVLPVAVAQPAARRRSPAASAGPSPAPSAIPACMVHLAQPLARQPPPPAVGDRCRRRAGWRAAHAEPRSRRPEPGRPWSRSCPASEASSGRPPTRRPGLPLVRWPWPSWSVGSSGSPAVSHWPRARRPRPICPRSGR